MHAFFGGDRSSKFFHAKIVCKKFNIDLYVFYRALEKTNPNFKTKVEELKKTGGVEASTEVLVPLVCNRDRYPNADKFLPKFILLDNGSVLVLKKKPNIIKYKREFEPLTMLILFESWRKSSDFDLMEGDTNLVRAAFQRRMEVFPFAAKDDSYE